MGWLRLYLAACVFIVHSADSFLGINAFLKPNQAVQCFFMISGFYMQMVLEEKYSNHIKQFYQNRFLRIFVPYYIVLICVLLISLISGILTSRWLELGTLNSEVVSRTGWIPFLVFTASNFTLFFQDLANLITFNPHEILWFPEWDAQQYPLLRLLFFPQGWSLSVELYFYMLCPLLFRMKLRSKILLILAIFSIKYYIYDILGLYRTPWQYNFFPLELSIFLLGMVSYKLLAIYKNLMLPRALVPLLKLFLLWFLTYFAATDFCGHNYDFPLYIGSSGFRVAEYGWIEI